MNKCKDYTSIDKEILKLLSDPNNPKTLKDISDALGLPLNKVSYRIKVLRNSNNDFPPIKRGRPQKRADDQIDLQIKKGYEFGKTQRNIGEEIGLGKGGVSSRLQRIRMRNPGIQSPIRRRRLKTTGDARDQNILECRLTNNSQTRIASELGVTPQCISKREQLMKQFDPLALAKMILNLMITKGATQEQVRTLGQFYGVENEVESLLIERNGVDK